MTIGTLLLLVLGIIVIGWLAHMVITKFFPPNMHMPLLMIVGVILLLVILAAFFPNITGVRIW